MKAQDIFNIVITHLIRQGEPAISYNGDSAICCYRDAHGRSCAVGCLIPDEAYDPRMENQSVCSVIDADFPGVPKYFKDHLQLLSDLQGLHDNVHEFNSGYKLNRRFVLEVLSIARHRGLNTDAFPELEEYLKVEAA